MLVFDSWSAHKGPYVVLYDMPERIKNGMAYIFIYISYLHEQSEMNVAGETLKMTFEHP